MSTKHDKQKEDLLRLVRDIISRDDELRAEYEIGGKFKFIRDRLDLLLANVEEHFAQHQEEERLTSENMATDEKIVFVHLFNAQGMILNTWKKMVNASVFYEYSVNRPIYAEQSHVDALIRAKSNKIQHGYLAIAVKEKDILPESSTDSLDNPLIKVREGALNASRLLFFAHNGVQYTVSDSGELVQKE